MSSVPVQLIAWEDRPWIDLLFVKWDVKQLLTQSLTDSEGILEMVSIWQNHRQEHSGTFYDP